MAKKGKGLDSAEKEAQFFAEGHVIPKCVNPGCHNEITCRDWKNWSFKSECTRCATARKEKRYIIEDNLKFIVNKGGKNLGIIIHKETFCENRDGHLGFMCPIPSDVWENGGFESGLDLDHVNGNHYDNDPENVQTYCKMCHGRKSLKSNDCNSNKPSARTIEVGKIIE
jgi:hypothetical protein